MKTTKMNRSYKGKGEKRQLKMMWKSCIGIWTLICLSIFSCILLSSFSSKGKVSGIEMPKILRASPMPIFNDYKLMARQDQRENIDQETYNTTTSALPTGASQISGQPPPTTSVVPEDPLLAIMPDFAFSMPAQMIVSGVNIALTTVLVIQLIFTMQYHYPLSKRNYILQSCSTIILLISLAVQLHSVLHFLEEQVHGWPYRFHYIAVEIPPQDGSWTITQEAFFLLMRAISAFFIHLTHIQFLTLLFPSALEARLILWMLGPLALAASGMEFTALSSDDDVKTSDLGDAIRNICNSTLFLLYSSGLLVWGLLVNRRRAWRTDGGTAAFGGGSVGLAFVNTTVSFVEIAFDRLWWLPEILWTLTLWQSWLGFWWWVGSGMGIGEVEDRAERQERRRKRAEKLRRKREREEKARLKAAAKSNGTANGTSGSQAAAAAVAVAASIGENGSDVIRGGIRRLTSKFSSNNPNETRNGNGIGLNRRNRINKANAVTPGEEIELDRMNDISQDEDALHSIAIDNGDRVQDDNQTVAGTGSQSSDTHPTTSVGATSSAGWLNSVADFIAEHQPNFIRRRMQRLRIAHVAAAQRAATEQSVLRDQVLNRQSEPMAPGLRSMMFDNRNSSPSLGQNTGFGNGQRRTTSLAFQTSSNGTRSLRGNGRRDVMPILLENGKLRKSNSSGSGGGNRSASNSIRSMSVVPEGEGGGDNLANTERRRHSVHNVNRSTLSPGIMDSLLDDNENSPKIVENDEEEWVDEEEMLNASNRANRESSRNVAASDIAQDGNNDSQTDTSRTPNQSWTWRGGLRGMRMRDHTVYDD